jgi:hypothetical protein
MQHQQLQIHEGLTLQMALLCIVASCVNRKDGVVFGMDLLQSVCFQYMSIKAIKMISCFYD